MDPESPKWLLLDTKKGPRGSEVGQANTATISLWMMTTWGSEPCPPQKGLQFYVVNVS